MRQFIRLVNLGQKLRRGVLKQVVSSVILKPNQRVRVSLPDASRPIRIRGAVAWASFEMPKGKPAPQYRAGIEFFDADASAVQRFIDQKKLP